eukprot:486432-Rhodomonas_salina.1
MWRAVQNREYEKRVRQAKRGLKRAAKVCVYVKRTSVRKTVAKRLPKAYCKACTAEGRGPTERERRCRCGEQYKRERVQKRVQRAKRVLQSCTAREKGTARLCVPVENGPDGEREGADVVVLSVRARQRLGVHHLRRAHLCEGGGNESESASPSSCTP